MCCGNIYIQVQLTCCQVNKKRREDKKNFDDETLEVSHLPQAEKATAEQPRGPLGSSWEARVGIWKIGLCLFSFFRLLFFFLQTLRHLATLPGQPGPDEDLCHTEFLPLQVLHLLMAAFRLGRRVRNIITTHKLCQT